MRLQWGALTLPTEANEKTAAQEHKPALPPVADRILVPIANPATAEGLLRLALALVNEEGQVIAAFVTVHGTEPQPEAQEKLEKIVATLKTEETPVELVTDLATSIPRGILDIAQERDADLIILGVRGLKQSESVLGPVVEAVARTAPCDVLVYRSTVPITAGSGYKDVIVPVDGSDNSRLAARIGMRFAYHANVPLTALYVQTVPTMRRWQALGHIEASLEDLGEDRRVRKQIVRSRDVVTGMLKECGPNDLVLLGFSTQSSLDNWLFGDIPQRMLSRTPGPLILVKQNRSERVSHQVRQTVANLMPTLTPTEELELVQAAREMSRPTTDFFVLVVLSCVIASLGLLQNSVAVIIGAMLVAPLMSPLVGFAVGLIRGDWRLMREAAFTLVRGMVLALVLAGVVALLSPVKTPTSEMLARGQPSLPDLGVAFFSGMVGAYAVARKDIPSALAGVAIAAALMPPLCTVGIALSFGLLPLASGSLFLFLTNIIAISLGAGAIFLWLGVRLRSGVDDPLSYRQRVIVALVVLVILAVPLTQSLRSSAQNARELEAVWQALDEDLPGEVVSLEWKDGTRGVLLATVRMDEMPAAEQVAAAEQRVEEAVGAEVTLELVVMQVVRAEAGQ